MFSSSVDVALALFVALSDTCQHFVFGRAPFGHSFLCGQIRDAHPSRRNRAGHRRTNGNATWQCTAPHASVQARGAMKKVSIYLKHRVLGAIDGMPGATIRERIKAVSELAFDDEDATATATASPGAPSKPGAIATSNTERSPSSPRPAATPAYRAKPPRKKSPKPSSKSCRACMARESVPP